MISLWNRLCNNKMGTKDWKNEIRHHFENTRLLEKCQADTVSNFEQFCEFIAEPAFEGLEEELDRYTVRSRSEKSKGRSVQFVVCFPGDKSVQFYYKILLPKNAVELKLKLVIRGRKDPKSELQAKEEEFMPAKTPAELLKLSKEELIMDFLEHYRNFTYESLTAEG